MRSFLILTALAFAVLGCQSMPTLGGGPPTVEQQAEAEAAKTYAHSLPVSINGEQFYGVGVIPRARQYQVTVVPDGKIERLQWGTCHQQFTIDRPPQGWFQKGYSFAIEAQPGIEDNRACALDIVVFTDPKSPVAFATLEISDARPEISLAHRIQCNGYADKSVGGVSICQSAAGLVQRLEFDEPVVQMGTVDRCDVMKPLDSSEKVWEFPIASRKCTYYFAAQRKASNGKRVQARVTTIGYTDVPALWR